jgi:hypothetical protein
MVARETTAGEGLSPLVDLSKVVDEYTQTQLELLQCVRELRAMVLEALSFFTEGAPNSELSGLPAARTTELPGTSAFSLAEIRPPLKGWTWTTSRSGTFRDYDYFADLDRKLARLEASLAEGLGLEDDGIDSSVN